MAPRPGHTLYGSALPWRDRRGVKAVSKGARKDVVTVEGLARDGALHPLRQAFLDHGAFQCGYCTPGMLMNAYALLAATPRPSPEAIATGMEDNLCRCGAHKRKLAAIAAASREGGRR